MDDYYVFYDRVPKTAQFFSIKPEESIAIPRHVRYDIIRDRLTGNDIGIAVYNGSAPSGFRSHISSSAWVFWKVGSLVNPVVRAFPEIPHGGNIILDSRGNNLKTGVS